MSSFLLPFRNGMKCIWNGYRFCCVISYPSLFMPLVWKSYQKTVSQGLIDRLHFALSTVRIQSFASWMRKPRSAPQLPEMVTTDCSSVKKQSQQSHEFNEVETLNSAQTIPCYFQSTPRYSGTSFFTHLATPRNLERAHSTPQQARWQFVARQSSKRSEVHVPA